MRSLADDRLEEPDRVVRHVLESDRPVDIRRTAVSTPLGREYPEALREGGEVGTERPRIDSRSTRMKQHQRLALPALVIPRVNPADVYVVRHLPPFSQVVLLLTAGSRRTHPAPDAAERSTMFRKTRPARSDAAYAKEALVLAVRSRRFPPPCAGSR
jgi:hypothetical protein